MKDVKHGAFACYWNGDKLVSKYYNDGVSYDGSTLYDETENRNGCVFNPPPGAKNFVVTLVGGGGGGAMGEFKNRFAAYYENGEHSFKVPANGSYEFLVLGAGGGGGAVDNACGNAETWPCGVTGSPGGLILTKAIKLEKDDIINIGVGKQGGTPGSNGDRHGQHGGDSQVSGSTFDLFAQGGGGGASVDYDSQNECRYYDNELDRDHLIYKREDKKHDCSSRNTARDLLNKSGNPGGYSYSGSGVSARSTSVGKKGLWYEYEKIGAYLYDQNWVKGAVATKNRNGKKRPNRNPGITKQIMDEFNISQYENQSNPFGSGGYGEGGSVGRGSSGGRGVVAVKWKQQYGALGGKAGSVLQIPFAELPQKTLAFPGKGGSGSYTYERTSPFMPKKTITVVASATSGDSTYLKNYPEVTGGAGATKINVDDPATYYSSVSVGDIIGANGAIANINPTKKPEGGAGGFSKIEDNGYVDNKAIDGGTRPIFVDGHEIASFNKLLGAGAGGGGGSALYTGAKGLGGNGSSGIVFIQW